jgi:pimeloyl-ACP methyl ester carboxylesterase
MMRCLSRFIAILPLILAAACSSPKAISVTDSAQQGEVAAKELSSSVANGTYVKKRIQLSLSGQRDAYILLFLHGDTGSTVTARPTVLMTMPYEGFDWSQDAVDRRWSSDPNAATGYSSNDTDSTNYPGSGIVGYQLKSESDLFGDANFYLLHGMNVAFVFNRFYGGATFVEHAFDTAMALKYLAKEKAVDPEKIGIYGLSWGGMTAAYGAILGNVPIKQLTLLSPALDLQALAEYYTNWIPANVASSSQKTAFATFYAPYGRRINPKATSLYSPAQIASKLSSISDHTTILADDSDTLVPTAKTRAIVSAMPSVKVSGLWWSHADAIDYETASLSHESHATQPLVFSDVLTIMQMDMAYALLPASANMTILIYEMNVWNTYLAYMRAEQQRGQDMTAFTRMLIQMAGPRVLVMNQQDNTQSGAGSIFVSTWLNLYWGVNITPANVVSVLESTGLPN